MILFRQRYPRWWFDFALELTRFGARIGAYVALLTDQYPSTVEEQSVHLEIDYPDVERDLNRWLPLVKWLLAIPHYVVLFFLAVGAFFAVVIAWFAILFTGRYPRGLFDFVVGVGRWGLRVAGLRVPPGHRPLPAVLAALRCSRTPSIAEAELRRRRRARRTPRRRGRSRPRRCWTRGGRRSRCPGSAASPASA